MHIAIAIPLKQFFNILHSMIFFFFLALAAYKRQTTTWVSCATSLTACFSGLTVSTKPNPISKAQAAM
jgi:hypothetical protein